VLASAEKSVLRHLPGRDGELAMSAFIGVLQVKVEQGFNLSAQCEKWKRELRKPETGALALIDHVVTHMKAVAEVPTPEGQPPMTFFIGLLERVIDAEFEENPGSLVPYNGQIGRIMSAPQMARYFKQAD
jgi:hypothetical protein